MAQTPIDKSDDNTANAVPQYAASFGRDPPLENGTPSITARLF